MHADKQKKSLNYKELNQKYHKQEVLALVVLDIMEMFFMPLC